MHKRWAFLYIASWSVKSTASMKRYMVTYGETTYAFMSCFDPAAQLLVTSFDNSVLSYVIKIKTK